MRWEVGSAILGFGFAMFTWVASMLGLVLPQWLLILLLGLSFLLILVWPVSFFITKLVADPKKQPVAHIRAWGVIGLVGIITFSLFSPGTIPDPRQGQIQPNRQSPNQNTERPSAPSLVVESMPSSSTLVPHGNQPCPVKVAKLAVLKVRNVSGVRISNVGMVVLEMNDFAGPFQPQLSVSSLDILFDCPNRPHIQVVVDLNPGEDALFGAVIECVSKKYCSEGRLGIPYVDAGAISFLLPVIEKIERFDKLTVRASGNNAIPAIKTFHVSRSTDGIALKEKTDQ